MHDGFVKLHRKILDSAVFDNPILLKVWIWCLCKATHTERTQIVGKQIVELKKGQFIFGRLKHAEVLKMHDRTLYDYMKMLEKLGQISIESNNKFSVVTVINWEQYQKRDDISQQQSDITPAIESAIENNTNKNVKNVKKKKNIISGDFIPPTVEEVKAYCAEKGYGVDAEYFVAYYRSNDWHKGNGQKIKEWKLSVDMWQMNSNSRKENRSNAGSSEQNNSTFCQSYADRFY